MKIRCKNTGEIAYSYAEYLKTQHWKCLREQAFQKANGICKCCKSPLLNNFICHHKTYSRIGKERIRTLPYSDIFLVRMFQKMKTDDIIAVCCHCHDGKSNNHEKLHEFVRVPEWARNEKDINY